MKYARPGHDQFDAVLRAIRATMQACEEGDLSIIEALDRVHNLSDPDTDVMMDALSEFQAKQAKGGRIPPSV